MKQSICIAGKSGQGIRKAGEILAKAGLLEGMNVIQTVHYTPEVREGESSTDVIISDNEIWYPFAKKLDVLIIFTENALKKNLKRIKKDTIIIYDSDHLSVFLHYSIKIGIPFIKLGSEIKKAAFPNMIALGVLISITDLISPESLLKVLSNFDIGEANISAFLKGIEIGKEYEKKLRSIC